MAFPPVNLLGIALVAGIVIVSAAVLHGLYNLSSLHPLSRFPGPVLFRASHVPWAWRLFRGRLASDILEFHKKYGPVVRIAPNELSFDDADAWRDIYGHRVGATSGMEEMSKYQLFYRVRNIPPSIIAEDRENHAMLRRQLAHGFSERAMRDQEPIIGSYVDLLMRRLREHCIEEDTSSAVVDEKPRTKPKALNMTSWYNWTTFDVIGDLAFGEPFGCLDGAQYHPWVAAINETIRTAAFIQAMKYVGFESVLDMIIKYAMAARKHHNEKTRQKLLRRMELDVERPDLIEGLLKKKDDWNISIDRLQQNASTLIIAGSETTATLLSGVTYLLLSNPAALEKLTNEVRSTFKSDEEITLTSVNNLSYMLACLNEALRAYPPVPIGLPRVVPKGGAPIAGHAIPEGTVVAVWQWATYHSEKNFVEPFSYRPERFLRDGEGEGEFKDDKLDALQPFSVGPRNCIGRNLAYAEMRLILARIIFNFDMKLADEKQNWLNQPIYVLWKKHPLMVHLTPVR